MSVQEFIPAVDMPTLLHFPIVHFATAFLVIAILLEVINIFFKRKSLSVFSLLVIVLVASLMILAYLTVGINDKELIMIVADSGKSGLSEYKEFGTYLAYGALALIVLKLLFMTLSSGMTRLSFAIMLIGYLVLSVNQITKGTLLKQVHGIDSQAISIIKDERDRLKNRYAILKESCQENSTDRNEDIIEPKELIEEQIIIPKVEEQENIIVEEESNKTSNLTVSLKISSDTNETY